MNFARNIPAITPEKLKNKFAAMFMNESKYSPFLNRYIVSALNVENVLRPPRNPVVRKTFMFSEKILLCLLNSRIKPISKPAKMLENKVPNGKAGCFAPAKSVMKYLRQEPIAPPNPTAK